MKNFIKRIVRTIITGYVLKWIKNKIEGNSKENNLKRSIHFILENRPFYNDSLEPDLLIEKCLQMF